MQISSSTPSEAAAMQLAMLAKEQLGVFFAPADLVNFIRENWTAVSHLAHAIHSDRPERT